MRPVYQMALGASANHGFGLLFSSEHENANTQSLMFVLPVPSNSQPYSGLTDYFRNERFYFPALYRQEVVNVESETDLPFIRFRIPYTHDYLMFEIALFAVGRTPFSVAGEGPEFLPYVGRQLAIAGKGLRCVPLIPDVLAMDDAYTQHGFVLVGLTPQFGTLRE
jgi:hypothetical protein